MRFLNINFYKMFNTFLFIVLSVLLLSQIIKLSPEIHDFLKNESIYTASGDNFDEYGEMTLKINENIPHKDILVLQNGEPIAIFLNDTANIAVRDNSVIEIDGSKLSKPFSVSVVKKSDNIKDFNVKDISVNKNIVILGRIFLK